MHLKLIHLQNFRGFSDFTIADIPATARLVMLIGPNGTGKSSIFDALLSWTSQHGAGGAGWDLTYHVKHSAAKVNSWPEYIKAIEMHEGQPADTLGWKRLCYVRSAYRNEPDFSQGNLGALPDPAARRFGRTIENDAAVSVNYRRIIMQTIKDVWGATANRSMSVGEYTDAVVKKVNDSLGRVIPHLKLESLGDPSVDTGNFYFTKGISKGYAFKNLSGGEKAVFDLIIDLISKMPYFDNSLICIDEPESHVNPAVQGALLKELLNLIPENDQLLVATHAIGMLRAARDIEAKKPGTVAFINFDANFDETVVLKSAKMDRPTWERALAVALDDLSALVSPKRIIVCEGGGGGLTSDAVDARVYNRIFADSEPDTHFLSAGSHASAGEARSTLIALSKTVLPGLEVKSLIDRDDRSDNEVATERSNGNLVLTRRNLEAYLFADEILRALCVKSGQPVLADELIKFRDQTLTKKGAKPGDFKVAAGETYVECKKRLGLSNPGNNAKAFMEDTLAALVAADTQTFKQLSKDAFG